MDVYQIAVMPLCSTTIQILFLTFFKRLPPKGVDEDSEEMQEYTSKWRKISFAIFGIFVSILTVDILISVCLVRSAATHLYICMYRF